MDSTTVSATKGADVFVFDYEHLDVVYSVTLGAGYWGLYQADGTVAVRDTLTPQIGSDGVTSQPGTFKTSISLVQVPSYSSARVHYDGSGFTLSYTLNNGTSWTALPEDGVITLPANADLDLKVTFPGNIANDTAVVNSLTVYVLKTETVESLISGRTLHLRNNALGNNGSIHLTTGVVIDPVNTTASLETGDPTPIVGSVNYTTSTIEFIGTLNSLGGDTLLDTGTSGTAGPGYWSINQSGVSSYSGGVAYINGVAANVAPALSNSRQYHFVFVFNASNNITTTLGTSRAFASPTDMSVNHLAFYNKKMTANDVTNLYIGQTGGKTLSIDGGSVITVTEYSPAVDIYAYAWQIQSGGTG